MAPRKRDAASLVEATQALLAEVKKEIAALTGRRQTALLHSDDRAIDALDAELDELRKQATRHSERIALLNIQAEREAGERRLRERAGLLERFAKKLDDADAIAAELQDDIARAEKKFRAIVALREEARAAFAVRSSHAQAAAGAPEGCAMAGSAVAMLLAFEFYRISYRPFLGGGGGHTRAVSFPGALCPRSDWALQPLKIPPFAETLKRGSQFAVELLRTELALPPTPEPESAPLPTNGGGAAVPQLPPAAAAIESPLPPPGASAPLVELLARQNTLAADPSREAEYLEVVKQIAALQ